MSHHRQQLMCAPAAAAGSQMAPSNLTTLTFLNATNATNGGTSTGTNDDDWLISFQWAFTNVILPVELAVGFVAQCLNFVVLHRYKIRTLTYTAYLRTLCAIYLLTIPMIAFSELQKAGWFSALAPYYSFVFFSAHFKYYLINTLLFSANLITTVLAAESLRGLTNPFQSMRSDGTKRSIGILAGCLLLTALVLLPVAFRLEVKGPDDLGDYCISRTVGTNFLRELSNVLVPIFESFLVLLLMGMYGALFIKYRLIMRESREISSCNRQHVTATHSNASNKQHNVSKHHKAIGICLGSIGAYVISNLPSALKETVNLINSFATADGSSNALDEFKSTQTYKALAKFCNMALFLNFTLIVLLQVLTSLQYRECLFRLLACCFAGTKSPVTTRNGHFTNTNANPSKSAATCKSAQAVPLLRHNQSVMETHRHRHNHNMHKQGRTSEVARQPALDAKQASFYDLGTSVSSLSPRLALPRQSAPHVDVVGSPLSQLRSPTKNPDGTIHSVLSSAEYEDQESTL